MQPSVGHRLADIPGLDPNHLARLGQQWLDTAEQVLGLAASLEGRLGLQRLLGCSSEVLAALLAKLEAAVGPAETRRLRQPAAGGARGLLLTEEQRERFMPDKPERHGEPDDCRE